MSWTVYTSQRTNNKVYRLGGNCYISKYIIRRKLDWWSFYYFMLQSFRDNRVIHKMVFGPYVVHVVFSIYKKKMPNDFEWYCGFFSFVQVSIHDNIRMLRICGAVNPSSTYVSVLFYAKYIPIATLDWFWLYLFM